MRRTTGAYAVKLIVAAAFAAAAACAQAKTMGIYRDERTGIGTGLANTLV